jgi:hypothetical protein
MTQVAHAELPPPTGLDPAIVAPAGNELFLIGHVLSSPTNVQTYTCNGGSWGTSSVPTAELSNDQKVPIIKHFAGPTWQELPNGSTVVATRKAGVNDPDGDGIQWLLLQATKTTAGRNGHLLSDTTYIQRLNTKGGVAPAGACTNGQTASVPYTADYYFYKATKA